MFTVEAKGFTETSASFRYCARRQGPERLDAGSLWRTRVHDAGDCRLRPFASLCGQPTDQEREEKRAKQVLTLFVLCGECTIKVRPIGAEVAAASVGAVTCCDAPNVAKAIDSLLHNALQRLTMGITGRNFVRQQYSLDRVVARLAKEYEAVIARGSYDIGVAR